MPVSLKIVSPEKLLLSRAVDMVVIPAAEAAYDAAARLGTEAEDAALDTIQSARAMVEAAG